MCVCACIPASLLLTRLCLDQSQITASSVVVTCSRDWAAISSKCWPHCSQPKNVPMYPRMARSTAAGSPSSAGTRYHATSYMTTNTCSRTRLLPPEEFNQTSLGTGSYSRQPLPCIRKVHIRLHTIIHTNTKSSTQGRSTTSWTVKNMKKKNVGNRHEEFHGILWCYTCPLAYPPQLYCE